MFFSYNYCRIQFAIYLMFVGCFTTAVVLAVKSSEVWVYNDGVDGIRAICELLVLFYSAGWIAFAILLKVIL